VGLPYQEKVKHIGYLNSIRILRKVFTDKFDDAHAPNNGRLDCRRIRMLAGAKYSFYTNLHDITAESGELFRRERAYCQCHLRLLTGASIREQCQIQGLLSGGPLAATRLEVLQLEDELCTHLRNQKHNNA